LATARTASTAARSVLIEMARVWTRLANLAARGTSEATSNGGPQGSAAEGELSMTNIRLRVVFLSMLLVAGLTLATSRLATAEEIVTLRTTLVFDGALDRDLSSDNPAVQYVSHNLCGIGLGGYCPRGYRGCIRAGRPKAECEDRLEQCEACNQAMVQCRQKVGHQSGYTCAKCRKALDQCRAGEAGK
jgi:hypothetical protein